MIRVGNISIDKAGESVMCRGVEHEIDAHRCMSARTFNNPLGTDPVISFKFLNGQRVQGLTLSADGAKALLYSLMAAFNVAIDEKGNVLTDLEAFSIKGLPFPFTIEQYHEFLEQDRINAEEEQAKEHPTPPAR